MTDKVMSVVPLKQPDNNRVIEILEEALAEARAGTIDGIVLVQHHTDRKWRSRWHGISYPESMGYLLRVIHKLNASWDEEA